MKYMGSKAKIKQYIIPIIQDRLEDYNLKTYIEPFCGGLNIIDSVNAKKRIASDINKYLIELYKHIDEVKNLPDIITHETYSKVRESYYKNDNTFEDWYIGAIGFLASYNGRFFDGGFSGIRTIANGKQRNYYLEAKNNLISQFDKIKGIEFKCGDYEDLYSNVSDAVIYCDIPYKNTKQYNSSKNFDYERFWFWADRMSDKNIVLVSEEQAPFPFEEIWKKETSRTINNKSTKVSVEKLFERIE